MRVLDQDKQRRVRAAAARLFATRPFHQVRLDDIAAAAGVGKGTIYLYCRDKQDLLAGLRDAGMAELIGRLREGFGRETASMARLGLVIEELVDSAFRHPEVFKTIRTTGAPADRPGLERRRRELYRLIAETIRQGVRRGEWRDPQPGLTAVYIPGMVRSVMLYGPRRRSQKEVSRHLLGFVAAALRQGGGHG